MIRSKGERGNSNPAWADARRRTGDAGEITGKWVFEDAEEAEEAGRSDGEERLGKVIESQKNIPSLTPSLWCIIGLQFALLLKSSTKLIRGFRYWKFQATATVFGRDRSLELALVVARRPVALVVLRSYAVLEVREISRGSYARIDFEA
ncbi:predicted protein [Sclerotinia sclerotiorum 1980 UF-70]|uniref:Uncharacterized protein n=2 Tax=Sclerotinia sclerotiorum (strain ATCC 18683 / 1980 / Ss-1) TaxID=665079 RepID=A7F7F0_SCLS1|nr:predicted protein [Sclerotinia sclerotiorum 1980 UF-70]APA15568.1 hypothetical protein sscle_15g103380 [Sclerotinia sclerotiorum 1980 UF-70]EDN98671.1 predicted protein [Sclerotinia sclerotiorum 1980 UF-70]